MRKQTKLQDVLTPKTPPAQRLTKHLTEGAFIVTLALAVFILASLLTYQIDETAVTRENAGGRVGLGIAYLFYTSFGYFSYAVPLFIFYLAAALLIEHRVFAVIHRYTLALRGVGLLLFIAGGCGLLSMELCANPDQGILYAGGIIGQLLMQHSTHALNVQGTLLLLSALCMIGVSWVTGLSWTAVIEALGRIALRLSLLGVRWSQHITRQLQKIVEIRMTLPFKESLAEDVPAPKLTTPNQVPFKTKNFLPEVMPRIQPIEQSVLPLETSFFSNEARVKPKQIAIAEPSDTVIPSLNLLTQGSSGPLTFGYSSEELEALSRDVEQHLLDFGIQVDVVAVHPGPVITRFELQLAAGIKVSRLSALVKDLARSLSVTSVRIVEIIPGKTVVGIELPNPSRKMVSLSDVLSAEVYQQAHSPVTLALGVDIAGHPMVVDLAKMPHLLVAGTTGSGKSVGINAMILSILFKATPEQVRLIMVDPKMLELSIYDGIPHLLTPVVTDMKEAASALRWCVAEMERRYKLMAALGVRNVAGYNTLVSEADARGDGLLDPLWKITDTVDAVAPKLQKLPYIVVIIDELADMMMVVGKKVEQLIARIAQKARASGIHLILATQRPSVDVLTGLIKSNIPTRISFQVSSKIDSRTILDQQGAEQLLGHGDMLFLAPGTGAPLRVHGAFVDDQEVHRVADAWRAKGVPEYIDDITQVVGEGADGDFGEERSTTEDSDPLYDDAVAFVMQTRKASISSVQRRFKIGYNRAARLVEEMERCGLVGPLEGGFRDVLVHASVSDE